MTLHAFSPAHLYLLPSDLFCTSLMLTSTYALTSYILNIYGQLSSFVQVANLKAWQVIALAVPL